MRLDRLTFVHHGDSGTIGRLIAEARGVLKFGGEGSSVVIGRAVPAAAALGNASPAAVFSPESTIRISAVPYSALPPAQREALSDDDVPCLLGHAGESTITLLNARSCARVVPALSDLRGKIRYSVARVGWKL